MCWLRSLLVLSLAAPVSAQTIVFHDEFTEASNTSLANHTPTDVGTNYTLLEQTGSVDLRASSADELRASANGANQRTLYTGAPSPSVADYDIQIDVVQTQADADAFALLGRVVDSSNYYAAILHGTGQATTVRLIKNVASSVTTLDSGTDTITAGDVVRFSITDAAKTVYVNDVEILTSADNDLTAAGTYGVAYGNIAVATDDIGDWRMDSFVVTEAASALPVKRWGRWTGTVSSTPVVRITTPTVETTYSTTTAAQTIGGTCVDAEGVSSVDWTCDNCTVTSGTATGTTGWTQAVTLTTGENLFSVTCTDTDSNVSAADTLTLALSGGDVTAPTVSITTPSADPHTSSTSPISIEGTSSDDTAVTTTTASETSPLCSLGANTGTLTSFVFALTCTSPATTTVTVQSCDAVLLCGQDTVVVTYSGALDITTTSLANCVEGSACNRTMSATGGLTPYTWSEASGGEMSLDSDCAGLSFADSGDNGAVSGTPTVMGGGTCTFTAQVDDDEASTDTQVINLVINASGSGAGNDYYDNLLATYSNCGVVEAGEATCIVIARTLRSQASIESVMNIDSFYGSYLSTGCTSSYPTTPYTFTNEPCGYDAVYDATEDAYKNTFGTERNEPPTGTDLTFPMNWSVPNGTDTWTIIYDFKYSSDWKTEIDAGTGWSHSKNWRIEGTDDVAGSMNSWWKYEMKWKPTAVVASPGLANRWGTIVPQSVWGQDVIDEVTVGCPACQQYWTASTGIANRFDENAPPVWEEQNNWGRHVIHWEENGTPFPATSSAITSTMSSWFMDEDTPAVKRHDALKHKIPWNSASQKGVTLLHYRISPKPATGRTYHPSPSASWANVSTWIRNVIVLHNYPTASINALLQQPVP